MNKRCAECSGSAIIGSRCGTHWADRQAKLQKIDFLWWKTCPLRRHLIQRMVARYTALAEGFEVPSVERIFEGLRPYRASEYAALVRIVNAADAAGKREHASRTGPTDSDRSS